MHERISSIVVGVAEIRDEDPHFGLAVELAEAVGAVLHAVHAFSFPDAVLAPLNAIVASNPEELQTLQHEMQSRLEALVSRSSGKSLIVCHAVPGSPAEAIVSVAEREEADLVIVGASSRGALASALLGTTAQRVLRASSAPVLVNRRPPHGPPRRILLTTDLSELSLSVHERGIELVAMLWGSREAEVRTLLVAGDDVLLPPPLHQIAMRERAEARLDTFLKRIGSGGRGVEGKVRLGLSGREILAEAEEWRADLLVLGTHGRTGFSRFLIGSVAETVSRKAPCDVLMIPAAAIGSAERGRTLAS